MKISTIDQHMRIMAATNQLNAWADAATNEILNFESVMGKLCPGVEAWVGEGPMIGYKRTTGGLWRVVNKAQVPLVEAPREDRILGAANLPRLRAAILNAVEDRLGKVQAALLER